MIRNIKMYITEYFFHPIFTIQALAIRYYAKVNISHTHIHKHTHRGQTHKRIQFQNISVWIKYQILDVLKFTIF